jgi:hypothetical protein
MKKKCFDASGKKKDIKKSSKKLSNQESNFKIECERK